MWAPLVLSVSNIEEKKFEYDIIEKEPNIYVKLFRELGTNKRLWYVYLGTALFAATVTQLAVFVNQILIDYVLPSFQLNILVLFAVGFGININDTVSFSSGEIMSEIPQHDYKTPFDATPEQIFVNEGQPVKKGDTLIVLVNEQVNTDYEVVQSNYEAALKANEAVSKLIRTTAT